MKIRIKDNIPNFHWYSRYEGETFEVDESQMNDNYDFGVFVKHGCKCCYSVLTAHFDIINDNEICVTDSDSIDKWCPCGADSGFVVDIYGKKSYLCYKCMGKLGKGIIDGLM